MKSNKINFLLFFAAFVFFAASCKKSFYTGVNQNPNVASTVKPNLLLPTVEAALGYTQGGDISRYSSLITQQIFGANSQSQSYYIYGYNPGTFDNVWPDLYTSTMENNYSLIQIADAGGYHVYSGVARILMAYTLQVTVDCWGKIPYSQAFKGNQTDQNLHPVYDDDKALYDTIASLIDVGITQLSDADQGPIVPGTDDGVYAGDVPSWIRFGHAIKARLYMHQSKGNAAMATSALAEIAQSFTGNSQNAQYIFGNAETAANPWYQFFEQRPGDENFSSSTIAARLLALNDPRYPEYNMDSTDSRGNNTSYFNMINSPVEFITYDELLFMQAEATLRTSGDIATAQTLFQSAIQANMTKLGIAASQITPYVAANGTLPVTSADDAIAALAAQEYLALFLNPEVWTLWRRTGSPALTPVSGSAIPRRLLYPQSEISYNSANVPTSVTLFSPKVFWDN